MYIEVSSKIKKIVNLNNCFLFLIDWYVINILLKTTAKGKIAMCFDDELRIIINDIKGPHAFKVAIEISKRLEIMFSNLLIFQLIF